MTAAKFLSTLLLAAPSLILAPTAQAQDSTAIPEGCVARVEALPASLLFDPEDPRLQGEALVVVFEADRRTMIFHKGALASMAEDGGAPACWRVALGVASTGEHPTGPKRRRGDRMTPHGWYRTSDKPWSNFAPAVAIHYPNGADARAGLTAGLVSEAQVQAIEQAIARDDKPSQKTRLGGEILFHGGGSRTDWTWGCVAFDDDDNTAFRSLLPADMRTDVLILP
jgi:hypothetical protein